MMLREYIDNLQDFAKLNPGVLDKTVYTSIDDEGNGYNVVHYSPSIGVMDDGDLHLMDSHKEAAEDAGQVFDKENMILKCLQ